MLSTFLYPTCSSLRPSTLRPLVVWTFLMSYLAFSSAPYYFQSDNKLKSNTACIRFGFASFGRQASYKQHLDGTRGSPQILFTPRLATRGSSFGYEPSLSRHFAEEMISCEQESLSVSQSMKECLACRTTSSSVPSYQSPSSC